MFGSIILDVGVGLVLIYLLLSLIASSIREGIAALFNTRAKILDDALHKLLDNDGTGARLIEALYEHPMISTLYDGATYKAAKASKQLPAYIPPRNFAIALMDLATRGMDPNARAAAGAESTPISVGTVRAQVARLGNANVQRAVLVALDTAKGDLATAQANIEAWFNSMMDRVSGWYKHRTQYVLFAIGVALAALLDADTVRIARELYREPAAREVAVAMASGISSRDTATATTAKMALAKIDSLGQPLGLTVQFSGAWPTMNELAAIGHRAARGWFGWLLTALAISLGAPFWFDALNKIVTVRSTLKPGAMGSRERGGGIVVEHPPSVAVPSPGRAALAPVTPAPGGPARSAAASAPNFEPHSWASGHPDAGIL